MELSGNFGSFNETSSYDREVSHKFFIMYNDNDNSNKLTLVKYTEDTHLITPVGSVGFTNTTAENMNFLADINDTMFVSYKDISGQLVVLTSSDIGINWTTISPTELLLETQVDEIDMKFDKDYNVYILFHDILNTERKLTVIKYLRSIKHGQ